MPLLNLHLRQKNNGRHVQLTICKSNRPDLGPNVKPAVYSLLLGDKTKEVEGYHLL